MDEPRGFPVLRTRRLVLRDLRRSDAPAVFEAFSQEATTRYHNVETMGSPEQAEKLAEARTRVLEQGLGVRWGIVLRKRGDSIIGSCGYYNLNRDNRCVEIGYDLHPAFWRQGIMTEALTAVIDYGFGDDSFFPLNRIEALKYVDHEASAELLKKLGFHEEGVRREYGHWKVAAHDLRSFSLLRRDWRARGTVDAATTRAHDLDREASWRSRRTPNATRPT